jgi:hypothetical protein
VDALSLTHRKVCTSARLAKLPASGASTMIVNVWRCNYAVTEVEAPHDACFKQANEKNLRQEARWKFMIDCMKN